jgi:general secretion pathway protein J
MAPARTDRGSGGFALVEALASLVIVGMIGLMLVAGVTTGQRVWERIDVREAAGEAVDSAQTALRDRIEQIYPATLFDESPPEIDFKGGPEELTFLASPEEAGRPAPLRRYRLFLDPSGEVVLASVSDVAPEGAAADKQVLLTGVRRLELGYFGPAANPGRQRWWSDWNARGAPPQLIRVRIAFEPGDDRLWPDLLVHPRSTIDTLCLLNPASHRCKGRP